MITGSTGPGNIAAPGGWTAGSESDVSSKYKISIKK